MDIQKNQKYYESLMPGDLCQCAYCRNYVKEIKTAYPLVSEYLESMGIDIEKPFETMPLEPDEKQNIEYIAVQYIAFGDKAHFKQTVISDITIDIAETHPSTDIRDNHFIIEIFPIILKWVM